MANGRPLDKNAEDIKRFEPYQDRDEDSALVAAGQALALPIEAKFLEQENVRGGEHAVVSRVPAPFGQGEGSPVGSGADLAAARRQFAAFLQNF